MEISINQVEYSNTLQGQVIHVFGRDRNRNSVHLRVTGFRPYFYAPVQEVDSIGPGMMPEGLEVETDKTYISIKGESLRRLYAPSPTEVGKLRENFTHYEADIPFATRFMIDSGLTGGVSAPDDTLDYHDLEGSDLSVPARISMIDIECEDQRGFPDPNRDAIICLTAWDSYDGEYATFIWFPEPTNDENILPSLSGHRIYSLGSEKAMLESFARYITEKDPDILSGWNFVDFDLKYLSRRMEVLGLPPDALARLPGATERTPVRGRSAFDLLTAYKKYNTSKKESYRLDAIAEDELGEKKLRYKGTLSDLWREDPATLIEYNLTDVRLCVGIDRKDDIIGFYCEIARYVGCPLDRTLNSSQIIDIFVLRKASGRFVLPSKGYASGEEFKGATVFEPAMGVWENVAVLDLKSLYPMCMMTINASPETKDPEGELHAPNGIRFRNKPDGLTRTIISELLTERDNKKGLRDTFSYGSPEYRMYDLQQNVLKVIMNTYYGVSGYARFRLYDREIGSAVTSVGRAIIEHTRDVITSLGYRVLYGDTDSCMVMIPDEGIDETLLRAAKIEKAVNDSYSGFARKILNADQHYFSIKFEKLYRRFFQAGTKKRYAGLLVWKEGKSTDRIDVTGFEIRRSDSPHLTREVQQNVLDLILRGSRRDEVKDYLRDIITRFRNGEFSLDDVGIPGGLMKSLDDYKTNDAHVRGAIYSNEYLGTEYGKGSKPKRVYIKRVPSEYQPTDVVCFEYPDEIPDGFVIDWEKMMETTLKQPISRIIEPLGWSWEDIDPTGTKQKSIFDF